MSSRTQVGAALVAVIALVIGFWLWSRSPEPPKTEGPRVAVVEPTPTESPRAPAARRSGEPSPQLSLAQGSPQPEETQKPYTSVAILDGLDPIQKERELKIGKSQGRDARNPRLMTFPSLSSFEAPNPIVIYAYLAEDLEREQDDGKKQMVADSRKVGAREMRGELRAADGHVAHRAAFPRRWEER